MKITQDTILFCFIDDNKIKVMHELIYLWKKNIDLLLHS
jgi:hypothetical protein